MKICIDAGHGGIFNNAVGYDGTLEKNENLTNAELLEKEMRKRGHTVFMTRISDKELGSTLSKDLNARVAIANSAGTDCFISCHENGYEDPAANGVEVIYGTNASQTSIQWANDCLDRLVAASGLRRRRTFAQGITVLTKTTMPCILVEFGFMTNKNDMGIIRAKRNTMIKAIADSCEAIFGKVDKPVVDPYAYKLKADAPLYRFVGNGKIGTKVKLVAYPISPEPNGVFAKIKDENGNEYLVEWDYLSKE